MAATTSADCLADEILSIVMAHVGKSDLKAACLICRRWFSLVIRVVFDTVYISPHKLDLNVFVSITPDGRLSWAVKTLVYDSRAGLLSATFLPAPWKTLRTLHAAFTPL